MCILNVDPKRSEIRDAIFLGVSTSFWGDLGSEEGLGEILLPKHGLGRVEE